MSFLSKFTGKQLEENVRPYKVYTAILNLSHPTSPGVVVLENTLGGEVVWNETLPGTYEGTLIGAFPPGKTFFPGIDNLLRNGSRFVWDDSEIIKLIITAYNSNKIMVEVTQNDQGTSDWLNGYFLEVRVYP